ncbi:MAG TPA: metallophosphoesterase family protein, partial [Polyangiaceae bacterium]
AHQVEELTPAARRYLSALPKTRRIESPRGTILLCHGLGEDDMASVRPHDEGPTLLANDALSELVKSRTARFVVNGHSHRPMLRTIDGLTIMNAGTLHPKHRPVCSVADFEAGQVQLYDVEPTQVTAAERWSFERGSRPVQYL